MSYLSELPPETRAKIVERAVKALCKIAEGDRVGEAIAAEGFDLPEEWAEALKYALRED